MSKMLSTKKSLRAFGILDSNSALLEVYIGFETSYNYDFNPSMSFLPCGFLRKWTPWRQIRIWNHQAPNDEQVIIKVSNSVNLRFQILHLCNISWQSIFIMKAGRITSKHYFDLLSIKAHIQICAPIVSSEFMGLSAPLSRRNFKDVFSQK